MQGGVKYSALAPGDEVTKSAEAGGALLTIHFDFDKYAVRDEDKPLLEKNARWLKLNSGVKVRIEGHADERGENEYNLALGDKRARSVMNYLGAIGINAGRLSTISYGEEKPVDPGHGEDAWARNRRAEFKIIN
ncbi:MAG: peptidoglycan-associated lipoprotein Pal [Deltaproteobacteria bacterium]|nr:peptidoglycan-associated lipoprotein Pal [Deltaproteobacteria bacterium]